MRLARHDSSNALLSGADGVFLAAARHRSFPRAARELGISQSAASQSVAQLEESLGFELFDRTTRPMTLTREAQVLAAELGRRSSDLREVGWFQPLIRVGLVESLARTVAPLFLRRLLSDGRRVILHTGTSDALLRKLLLDELDVIVATGPLPTSESLDVRFLFAEPHAVLLPADAAARRTSWEWTDLQFCGLPLIRYTSNTASGLQGEMVLAHARLELPMSFAVDDNLVVFSLVDAGMGWSLTQPLPLLEARGTIDHCTVLPAPSPCTRRELFVVRRKTTPVGLSECVGRACRDCLLERVVPEIERIMPWTAGQLSVGEF